MLDVSVRMVSIPIPWIKQKVLLESFELKNPPYSMTILTTMHSSSAPSRSADHKTELRKCSNMFDQVDFLFVGK